jgi:hypothetical protein
LNNLRKKLFIVCVRLPPSRMNAKIIAIFPDKIPEKNREGKYFLQ